MLNVEKDPKPQEVDARYQENVRRQIEGHITSYVARAADNPARIIKTVRTLMRQCGMTRDKLNTLFDTIYPGSVRPFLDAPFNSVTGIQGPTRKERFDRLKSALLDESVGTTVP